MSDSIVSLLAVLENCGSLLGRLYDTPKGIFTQNGDDVHLAKLRRISAVRQAHDESFRLDSGLRRWFDKALNRRRQFGPSVHYDDILTNLKTAVEDYHDALVQMNSAVISDRLNTIFELCDDFATAMTEDLEQFRLVIQTSAGFSGSTIAERIRYNSNRLKRAHELQRNLEKARDDDLVERAGAGDDLAHLLRKEFFNRHQDLHTRLREVADGLSRNLFELRRLDEAALDLMRLDNFLSRNPDFVLPDLVHAGEPPECFLRAEGMEMQAFPDPYNEYYADDLAADYQRIRDDPPPEVKEVRSNAVEDTGPPPDRKVPNSVFYVAFFDFIEHVLEEGGASATEWIRMHPEKFGFGETVWLHSIAPHHENGTLGRLLRMPDDVSVVAHRREDGFELILSDFEFYLPEATRRAIDTVTGDAHV